MVLDDSSVRGSCTTANALKRVMARRRGILAESHQPRLQSGVRRESVHEVGRSTDEGPVVVPKPGDEPRAVGREHEVRQRTLKGL